MSGPEIIIDDDDIVIIIDAEHTVSDESSDWYRSLEQPDEGEQYHPDNA